MLSVVKTLLKGEVGGCALNCHGNYIVDHGIVFFIFCGNPDLRSHHNSVYIYKPAQNWTFLYGSKNSK